MRQQHARENGDNEKNVVLVERSLTSSRLRKREDVNSKKELGY